MFAAIAAALLGAAEPAASLALPQPTAEVKPRKKPGKPPMEGVVNVNRASEAELRLLPGIGKRRAQLIVERRQRKPFNSLDDVGRIPGMHAVVQRLRRHLAVQGDTTIHPARP